MDILVVPGTEHNLLERYLTTGNPISAGLIVSFDRLARNPFD